MESKAIHAYPCPTPWTVVCMWLNCRLHEHFYVQEVLRLPVTLPGGCVGPVVTSSSILVIVRFYLVRACFCVSEQMNPAKGRAESWASLEHEQDERPPTATRAEGPSVLPQGGCTRRQTGWMFTEKKTWKCVCIQRKMIFLSFF